MVVVDWLQLEVPRAAELRAVEELAGWRNIEVFQYVRSYDWTARMYEGQHIIPVENVRWP